MPRGMKVTADKASIATRRGQLEAELARLADAEKQLTEAERDAGRSTLLSALGRVRVGVMDKAAARAIARAIEAEGGNALAARLASAEVGVGASES